MRGEGTGLCGALCPVAGVIGTEAVGNETPEHCLGLILAIAASRGKSAASTFGISLELETGYKVSLAASSIPLFVVVYKDVVSNQN